MAEKVYIRGILAGSKEEVNVAVALDQLKLDYHYQRVVGLRGVRGTQIIDFLVFTVPKPTPLFVHGEYWHTGKKAVEDKLKIAELTVMMHNAWAEPVIIWEEDCQTVDDAKATLRKLLML